MAGKSKQIQGTPSWSGNSRACRARTLRSAPECPARPEDTKLSGKEATAYRSIVARCNYLGTDRPDCLFAIKDNTFEEFIVFNPLVLIIRVLLTTSFHHPCDCTNGRKDLIITNFMVVEKRIVSR